MAQHRAASGEVVDLSPLGSENMAAEKTTALVKTNAFEAVRLVMKAGAAIATHQVAGPITLHCLQGRVSVDTANGTFELTAGSWVYLEGSTPHSLRAADDASLLLTIIFVG